MKKILSILVFFIFSFCFLFAEEAVDSENKLRAMFFEDEVFIPEIKDSQTVLINSAGKKTSRDFFDEYKRLVKKEVWEITTAKDSKKLYTEFYFYEKNSDVVKGKKIESSDFEEDFKFNNDGLMLERKIYNYAKPDKNKDERIKYLCSENKWVYDSKNRVSSYENRQYVYENENYSRSKSCKVVKENYRFHGKDDVFRDSEIFENGKLKSRIVYDEEGNYTKEQVFDSSYSVLSYYSGGKKIKDEYYMGGKIIRTKEF